MKRKICHMVTMGDSLTDRGTADNAYILGCIPMAFLAGLTGASPAGRFTNGYVWGDAISAMFASDFIIKKFKRKYKYTNDDIADGIINKDKRLMNALTIAYKLDDDVRVTYEGRDFIRSYAQGGLSAYNYAWKLSSSITVFFSRLILSTLAQKRKQLLKYDEHHQLSRKYKAQTLVIEWSGANDLITVNTNPTFAEVDNAIKERVKNLEILIKNGYRNFIWFNLPDLSLTPRFQNMTGQAGIDARANAHRCVDYFNRELERARAKLQTMFPQCRFEIFDVNSIFTKVYNNPESYGLERAKLAQPFTSSNDFKILPNQTAPAPGYMFWNDIHPSATVQQLLANEFYKKYNPKFEFTEPPKERGQEPEMNISADTLVNAFRARYADKLTDAQHGFFGSWRRSRLRYQEANLKGILKHALCDGGSRAREVLTDLQWIDSSGAVILNIPALKKAMAEMQTPQVEMTI